MPLDLTTISSPLENHPVRGAVDLARRMFLIRWSVGEYLTALAGNYGVRRPALGFRDDDFFRACAQVLCADHKTIARAYWQLLEIALGPYTNLVYELELDAAVGDTYVTLDPEMNYVGYTNWNTTAFQHNELVENGLGAEARFRYLDTEEGTFYFANRKNGDFLAGHTIVGSVSGGSVDVTTSEQRHVSETTRPVTDRIPHYGVMVIDPGEPNEETVDFVTVDRFRRRVRLRNPLTQAHSANATIFLDGGCWDLFETEARRVAIKIKCSQKVVNRIPGNSYLHGVPKRESQLRSVRVSGDATLELDESVVDGFPTPPFQVLIDPEEQFGEVLEVTVDGVNAATRVFSLLAGLPAGFRRPAGTVVRWVQTDVVTGGLTQNKIVGDSDLQLVGRVKDPTGLWILDRGGANEEIVFVTSSTYQRRQLHSDITPSTSLFTLDVELDNVLEGTVTGKVRVWDTTGLLGVVDIANAFWWAPPGPSSKIRFPQLGVTSAPAFSTSIATRETYVEWVEQNTGEVTWELARPLSKVHAIGETVERFTGSNPVIATDADYLPEAGWPPGVSPSGRWPGPYLHDPSARVLSKIRSSSASSVYALADVSRSDPGDLRAYLINQGLGSPFLLNQSSSTLGVINLPIPGLANPVAFATKDLLVDDNSLFPTQAQVQAWLTHPMNPNPGYPPKIVVGGEGSFGRNAVYYFGKGAAGTLEERYIFVAGLQLNHPVGTRVKTYHEKLPLETLSGVLAVPEGFPQTGGAILLDHTSEVQETVFYDSLDLETPTRGSLVFDQGWSPSYSHDIFRVSNFNSATVIGVSVVRTGAIAESLPLKNGYSFSAFLSGNALLLRLAYLLEQVRAAGVEVRLYDEHDALIQVGALIL